VVKVNTHNLSVVVTLFANYLRNCNSKGLQVYACEYAAKLIAKLPYSNSNRLCLAVLLLLRKLYYASKSAYKIRLRCMFVVLLAALI
jgi:hypothetical protein